MRSILRIPNVEDSMNLNPSFFSSSLSLSLLCMQDLHRAPGIERTLWPFASFPENSALLCYLFCLWMDLGWRWTERCLCLWCHGCNSCLLDSFFPKPSLFWSRQNIDFPTVWTRHACLEQRSPSSVVIAHFSVFQLTLAGLSCLFPDISVLWDIHLPFCLPRFYGMSAQVTYCSSLFSALLYSSPRVRLQGRCICWRKGPDWRLVSVLTAHQRSREEQGTLQVSVPSKWLQVTLVWMKESSWWTFLSQAYKKLVHWCNWQWHLSSTSLSVQSYWNVLGYFSLFKRQRSLDLVVNDSTIKSHFLRW